MLGSLKLRYLTLAALIIATPLYPMGGFLSSCKASITNIFNRQASARDVSIGLAVAGVASLAAYGLIKYLAYKRDYQRDVAYLKAKGFYNIHGIDQWHLERAIQNNDTELIRTLLRHDVSIYNTPLMLAIKLGKPEIVELLLSHNKKTVYLWPSFLYSIVQSALDEGRKDDAVQAALEPLLNRASGPVFNNIVSRAAGIARGAGSGNPRALDILIQHGKKTGKIKEQDLSGMLIDLTQYNLAKGRSEIIDIVLKHGANINAYRNGDNPLKTAVQTPKPKMARFLLDRGAEIIIPDTGVSVYRYVNPDFPQMWKPVTVVLDNHRRRLAMRYVSGIGTYLTKDTAGIVVQYLDPWAKERPLKSLELVDDGLGPDLDEDGLGAHLDEE